MTAPIDFLVIGAQKAGTTTIHDALEAHRLVSVPSQKETQFLSNPERQSRGLDWYAAQFDSAALVRGEVDPSYLYEPAAPAFVAEQGWVPKIVVVVRDPFERALSHYQMSVRRGVEPLGFRAAIEAEPERLQSGAWADRSHYSYVDRGRYVAQIERWRQALPGADFLFLYFDELRDAPEDTSRRLFTFLGVDPDGARLGHAHQSGAARSRLLAKVLWRRPAALRRLLHRLVPSERVRSRLAHRLDQANLGAATTPSEQADDRELRGLVWDRLPWQPDDLAEIVGRPAPADGQRWTSSNGQRSS
ncbi:MAG: hypothetical protein HKN26_13730 [Acidimicrobiales bacterium]|nr:hypothetical protein [Acidimicrobiales bacterium]